MPRNTGDETKSEIKLNRKMRMWNKYRNYFITGVVIVIVLIVLAIIFKGCSGKKKNDTKPTVTQQTTQADVTSNESTNETTTQATTAAPAQTQSQTTQAAQGSSGNVYKVEGTAGQEDFTAKDSYADTVVLGDFIAGGMSYYGYLSDSQVVSDDNMTTRKAADYIDSVASANPKKVVIMLGLNDANYGTMSGEAIGDNISEVVSSVKSKCPSAKIYVVSVLPVTYAFEGRSSVEQSVLDTINTQLESKAASMNVTYIDIANSYKDESGYLKGDCTGNGCNLNSGYYPFLLNNIAKAFK